MSAPKEILELVERFERNLGEYKNPAYGETEVRREFIDPFFKALGWDVDNREGYAEAYKDVVHEDVVKVGGFTKAPDYSFRIGGTRKFFVEAKRPSKDLKQDPEPAFQVRRYAWSAKLPLSILTDFEEFVVYDCRVRPVKTDKASVARTLYVRFTEYADRWDEIAAIFSKDAVVKGSFDKYADTHKKKRGTAEVDEAFLVEIEGWRETLAKNLALRNKTLTRRELNFSVQRIIDRIIFLRICEDRGIEDYGALQSLVNGNNVYRRLGEMFLNADAKYNSGLFHFKKEKDESTPPDSLTLGLEVDDKVLKNVIEGLYYPDSPYEFSVLSADILGQVYEQFLGKVIRLTAGHQAKIEEKPEVRKAGGVYYTPTYIVGYIVEQTVGELLKDTTPKKADKLKIVDPACGSGSFLIGAYQKLLDWYLDWYLKDGTAKHAKAKRIFQARGNEWRLTTIERKRILVNNIYGVDIDEQAVEVTKLSLLLKVLEGVTEEILQRTFETLHERALPDLGGNIKCGNSLIGSEFYDGMQMALLDEEERYRINVFDWDSEFPEMFSGKDPGFDAVIGNPPYVRIQHMKEWAPVEVEFYKERYKAAGKGNYDIYVVFVEKALSLLNEKGMNGFILPHKFFNADYGESLRQIISLGRHARQIVHFGHQQVFAGAATYTCLLFLQRGQCDQFVFRQVNDIDAWCRSPDEAISVMKSPVLKKDGWMLTSAGEEELLKKLQAETLLLGDVASIFQGLVTGADKVFILEPEGESDRDVVAVRDFQGMTWQIEKPMLKPFLKRVTVTSFESANSNRVLLFPYEVEDGKATLVNARDMSTRFPLTWKYLNANGDVLRGRERGKWNHARWYAFGRNQNLTEMNDPKIIVQVISLFGRYALDETGLYFTGGGNGPYYGVRFNEDYRKGALVYLQALLASRLMDFLLHKFSSPFRGGYWSYGKRFIAKLPIRLSGWIEGDDEDEIIHLAKSLSGLHRQLGSDKTVHGKISLQRQIAATDRQIDQLVYELYGLSDKEIKIVEDAVGQ